MQAQARAFWIARVLNHQVFAAVIGPPCETWTAARLLLDGPPRLRDELHLWGLPKITTRQRAQVAFGNRLLAFALDIAAALYVTGGAMVLEHPGYPHWAMHLQPASIWRVPLVQQMLALPEIEPCPFDQCVTGQVSVKPTTLMLVRLPEVKSALLTLGHGGRCHHGAGAHTASCGKDERGKWRTAQLKVYTPHLCSVLANGIFAFAEKLVGAGSGQLANNLDPELQLFHRQPEGTTTEVQPDYVPERLVSRN